MTTVVHLSGADGLLAAAERLREAKDDGDVVLVVPESAPLLANPLFLRALREERPERPLALVTPNARARAMASGCRLPAYASLAAYQQKTLDPTEPLERARTLAIAEIGKERARARQRQQRMLAAIAVAAALLFIVVPSAEVVIAADPRSLGPVALDVRTQPGTTTRLAGQVSATVGGTSTGVRVTSARATGTERFTNASTDRIEIGAGTIVSTAANVQFRTTQAKTLPPSSIFPFLGISEVQIPIEAVDPGAGGNVPAGGITRTADRRLRVTNDQATVGGEDKRTTFVQSADYTTASGRLDQALDAAARDQLKTWNSMQQPGFRVESAYVSRVLTRTASADVVGKEMTAFQLSATEEVTAYVVPGAEPNATALRGLADAAATGYEVVRDSVTVDVTGIDVTADGLIWHVRARASERPRLDETSLRFILMGQDPKAAGPLLAGRGLHVTAVRSFPSWWPRLPLFPFRIDIRADAVARLVGP